MKQFIVKYFIGLILFIVSVVMMCILYPIGFSYSILTHIFRFSWIDTDKYLLRCAIANDQHGNTFLAKLFNDTLIKSREIEGKLVIAYKFGYQKETISSVLGKNKQLGTLTKTGKFFDWILHLLDDNHSIESIETIIVNNEKRT